MTKALLLLAWVPLLSVSTPRLTKNNYPVTISCDTAWELMDIVKNDDVVNQRTEDRLLLELRKDVINRC
jgi:site-specific recombinase XerC